MSTPPPLPRVRLVAAWRGNKLIIPLGIIALLLLALPFVLRIVGLIHPFNVPSGAMAPAICAGDQVMMEGISYLVRHPRRGDIVVFKTDGIAAFSPPTILVERIAGEPGEHVNISDGKLYVNDAHAALNNEKGEITYFFPRFSEKYPGKSEVTVPDGHYFMLGDNSMNSYDSRFWGCVPRKNIIGRISFCYWPVQRMRNVK
jgi:signal peptidase I